LSNIHQPTDEYEADLTIWISILSVRVHIVSCENIGFKPEKYLGGFDSGRSIKIVKPPSLGLAELNMTKILLHKQSLELFGCFRGLKQHLFGVFRGLKYDI
jgi:hypothetical protein